MGVKVLRDLTEKRVNFSALATFDIQLLLVFGEVDQQTKLIRLVKKKCRKMNLYTFLRNLVLYILGESKTNINFLPTCWGLFHFPKLLSSPLVVTFMFF